MDKDAVEDAVGRPVEHRIWDAVVINTKEAIGGHHECAGGLWLHLWVPVRDVEERLPAVEGFL